MNGQLEQLILESKSQTFQKNSYYSPYGETSYCRPSEEFISWLTRVEAFLIENYGKSSSVYKMFEKFNFDSLCGNDVDNFNSEISKINGVLNACSQIPVKESGLTIDSLYLLNNLMDKFHLVVRQLRVRHDKRNTLDVIDEYDVQDLLHALLRLHFEDVRPEEWTPSFAGGSSRMDFLLKNEKTVIEVKMTRGGLNDAELGKQLIVDKERYKVHPDCRKLICFVYDPSGNIRNPKGIENELNSASDHFVVQVVIKP